jgi:predicted nucleic acid-binding protein
MAMRTSLLIDTNLFLEALLGRPRHQDVVALFRKIQEYQFVVSQFTVDSVGLYLFRSGQFNLFAEWLRDMAESEAFQLVSLDFIQRIRITEIAQQYQLDYDDAFQYAIAELYNLTIVSFDKDFDRTPKGRKEPQDLI